MIVDAAIIAVIGFFAWRGWRRGLLMSLAGLVGFVAATLAAVFGYRVLATPIRDLFGLSKGTASLAAAIAIFILVSIALRKLKPSSEASARGNYACAITETSPGSKYRSKKSSSLPNRPCARTSSSVSKGWASRT